MDYRQYVAEKAPIKWPYPVDYTKETREDCDILIVGGGYAGAFASIHAAKRGANVIVVDKGAITRSGAAGAGLDHWGYACTSPDSFATPDEMFANKPRDPFISGHALYITMKESYEALLDLEEFGVKIRDTDDKFKGAPFRGEESKLLYAYDYDNRTTIRFIGGEGGKPALHREMKRLGIKMYDRVMTTALLTEDGKPGNRVIGATCVNTRTGEFYVFRAKATILATGKPLRLWDFNTELAGSNAQHDDPNCAGDGCVMAWRAGAKLTQMDFSSPSAGGRRRLAYGLGGSMGTWYPCTLVDSQGKEIPWVDYQGNPIKTVEERSHLPQGVDPFSIRDSHIAFVIHDLPERMKAGEFKLPFFADMTEMTDHERRALYGVMLGNEGKTWVPFVKMLNDAGFDPAKDMVQVSMTGNNPDHGWWGSLAGPNIRETGAHIGYGGLVVDWSMKGSLEGLFAIGNQIGTISGAPAAAATGRYAGRTVPAYVKDLENLPLCEDQIKAEKERVYSFVQRQEGYGWKEVQLGLCRIMQDHCGDYRLKEGMELGLWWLNSIRENELVNTMAANPHDLGKVLDVDVRLTIGEIMLNQSIARKSSSRRMGVNRLDYPEDGDDCGYHQTLRLEDGKVVVEELPYFYWEEEGSYSEAYKKHCCL